MKDYPQSVQLQGTYSQLSNFQYFSILNVRNLLHLRAKLVDLDKHLEIYTLESLDRNIWKDGKYFLVAPRQAGRFVVKINQ